MSAEIIAEVGECFNGEMKTALRMISEAREAGCDTVKFQLLDLEEVGRDDPEREWFCRLELDPPKIKELIRHAQKEEINILFTPTSVRTAKWIADAGQEKVKIASSFVKKGELVEYINGHFQVVYASTGMASLDDIFRMLSLLDRPGEVKLLHCISEYPTGPLLETRGLAALDEKDAHLEMMRIMQSLFPGNAVGYSDHTDGIFVPVMAAAMGAMVIEKHFTLDRATPVKHYEKGLPYMGTDHVLSIEPGMMKEMVSQIRRVEQVRGERDWQRSRGEQILMDFLQGRYRKR